MWGGGGGYLRVWGVAEWNAMQDDAPHLAPLGRGLGWRRHDELAFVGFPPHLSLLDPLQILPRSKMVIGSMGASAMTSSSAHPLPLN